MLKRKSNLALLFGSLYATFFGVLGCSQSSKEVYVDLKSIETNSDDFPKKFAQNYSNNFDLIYKKKVQILSECSSEVFFSGLEDVRRSSLGEIKAKSHEFAFKQALKDITDVYLSEIALLEKEEQKSLAEEKRKAYELVYQNLRALFEKYTKRAETSVYGLASRVGHPDPDPKSLRPAPPSGTREYWNLVSAKKLRKELHRLDTDFRDEFNALLAEQEALAGSKAKALKEKISQLVHAAHERALRDVEHQLALNQRTESSEERNYQINLPALPALFVEIAPFRSFFSNRKGIFKETLPISHSLEDQLKLWLELYGYKASKRRGDGVDKTKEFEKWRREYEFNTSADCRKSRG